MSNLSVVDSVCRQCSTSKLLPLMFVVMGTRKEKEFQIRVKIPSVTKIGHVAKIGQVAKIGCWEVAVTVCVSYSHENDIASCASRR